VGIEVSGESTRPAARGAVRWSADVEYWERRAAHSRGDFSLRDARRLVSDLFEPRPWIYWTDFLVSIGIGLGALAALRRLNATPPVWIALYALTVLAIYRAAMFSHEVVHLRSDKFKAFRVVWNLLCGIPFLIPSFLYHTHSFHHVRKHYGTARDGEYLPLATGPVRSILVYLAQPFVVPLLAVARFLVLAPLSWVWPPLRRWVHAHASSMVIDPAFVRPLPSRSELRDWRLQEVACFAFLVGVTSAIALGIRPWTLVLDAYLVAVGVLMLNAIRTLAAHRYQHRGEEVSFVEQLLDSLNYPKWPILTGLWAPIGLRYHALHHLFPSLPYHALDSAHKRLMSGLPKDSPYRNTISPGLFVTIRSLVRQAWRSGAV
jgi:fatty acid desaturase